MDPLDQGDGDGSPWQRVPLPGADVRHLPAAWPTDVADALFQSLLAELPWQRHTLRMFGRDIAAPRLSCWIGDPDSGYTYSRTRFEPLAWTPTTAHLRTELSQRFGIDSNSVLANLYRDGRDCVGWHSDDEPELGDEPVIASASFGATRTFRLRGRQDPASACAIALTHGSLLVMAGPTQRHYRHALPRALRVLAPRINLTFRRVTPSGGSMPPVVD